MLSYRHREFGGIHPYVAIEAHQRSMVRLFIPVSAVARQFHPYSFPKPTAIRQALAEADMNVNDVDGIAYTRGPGQSASRLRICSTVYLCPGIGGCLSVGSNAAKNIASALNKPLVGVHHMVCLRSLPFLHHAPDSRANRSKLTL
jgi:N6-L-threonylcarbamoyladenine synthase